MKKLIYSVVAILTLGAASTLASCGGSEKENANEANDSTVTTPGDTTKVQLKGFESSLNIRYVDVDSLMEKYTYAKKQMEQLQVKERELQQLQNNLTAQIQKKQNEIQQKANSNGYLSQQSYEQDMKELQQQAQNAESQYTKKAQALANELTQIQQNIIKAIDNYIAKYNEEKKYDAILRKEAGLYFNPSLDITNEIAAGLNSQNQDSNDK